MPPSDKHLQDSLVVAFTSSTGSLKNAKWAICNRALYLECALLRKKVCPAFQDVSIDEKLTEKLPDDGVPPVLHTCCCQLEHSGPLTLQKKGPGAAPNLRSTELSETKAESDVESNYTEQEDDETSDLMPEQMIATDTQDATDPIACFALFRKKWKVWKKRQNKFARMKTTLV